MRRLALLLLFVAATGCLTPSEPEAPEPPVELPENWVGDVAPQEFRITETWWEDFGEPRLSVIVDRAFRNNPSLAAAEARVRQAAAQATIAGAALAPWVGGGASSGRSATYIGKSPLTEPTTRVDRHGVELNLSWEIDLWARIRSGEAAAVADVEAARALYHGARNSLAGQTVKVYFTMIESERQVKVAEGNLESAEDLLARIRDRFGEGLRSALDLKLAESEVSTARALLTARRRALDASKRQFQTLLASYPDGMLGPNRDLPDSPDRVPAGIPADVLARRPDLVAAEKRYVAAHYRLEEAEKSLYPRIALTASGGLTSEEFDDLLDGDFGVWSLVGSLSQPIFEGGRLRANVRGAEARRDEQVAEFANAVLQALAEVETSLAADAFLSRQEEEIEGLVEEAGDSVELSEERFLSGLSSFLGVLEARRRHFTAQSELLRTRLDRLNSRVDLYLALGGGFHRSAVEEETP